MSTDGLNLYIDKSLDTIFSAHKFKLFNVGFNSSMSFFEIINNRWYQPSLALEQILSLYCIVLLAGDVSGDGFAQFR
jgi:hypothetical protein